MKFIAIIPARFASSRFPGKPLAMIDGVSMIMRVYRQVKKVDGILDVVVATDDGRILEHVVKEGGKALLTSEKHPSGTDRVHEAASQLIGNHNPEDYVVINVQGDEPFIDPRAISSLMTLFEHADTGISTLIKKNNEYGGTFRSQRR